MSSKRRGLDRALSLWMWLAEPETWRSSRWPGAPGWSRWIFALGMLCAGRSRTRGAWRVQADAALLPLPDACADVVTCGFALRNFVNLDAVFRECARVLVAGGRVGFVEFDQPRPGLLRWGHELHLRRIVPRIGAWLSDGPAYRLSAGVDALPAFGATAHLGSEACGLHQS